MLEGSDWTELESWQQNARMFTLSSTLELISAIHELMFLVTLKHDISLVTLHRSCLPICESFIGPEQGTLSQEHEES